MGWPLLFRKIFHRPRACETILVVVDIFVPSKFNVQIGSPRWRNKLNTLVVEIFKTLFQTDFLVENKFQQNILHVVLKAGYYNKVREDTHKKKCFF